MSLSRTLLRASRFSLTQPARLQLRTMSTGTSMPEGLHIENTKINTAPGVTLDAQQKTIVGSVLDLFAGRPSLKKFQLWDDDGVFEDPIAHARGRKQFQTQFYGLQTAFSQIERLSHEVTNPGNPILVNMKTRYVVKGINKEQVVESVVAITTNDKGRISHLADKWNGNLPEGSISNVSLLRPLSWYRYAEAWAFWWFSWIWYTWPWAAFRRLNGESMPLLVSVPKNEEEDRARGNM